MTAMLRRTFWIPLVVLAFAGQPAPAGAQGQTPRPEVVRLVESFIAAVNGADTAADTFVKEHFTADYQKARTAEERRKWFRDLREKYGKVTLAGLRRASPETFTIVVNGEKGGEAEFEVTHDETFKISALALNQPGGE